MITKIIPQAILLLSCLCSLLTALPAQEEEPPKNWSLKGYVKFLQTGLVFNDAYPDLNQLKLVDTFLVDNLIHNRLNFQWFISEHFNFKAELRSRVFYGDLVKANPLYGTQIDEAANDQVDLSLLLLDRNSMVIHSVLDRLYLEYLKDKWEIRLGRQRINWGISTVWNPNDVFNAFNFTDFDYEERPGSDALRIRYFTGFASSIEVAASYFDHWDEAILATRWIFNKWNYDFQLMAGYVQQDVALGGGWAGNLGNAGFKSEFTWFLATTDDRKDAFAATAGVDYSFGNSLYLNVGYLYNSLGAIRNNVLNLFSFELSARNLYPYRHAVFVQVSYPVTPLLNAGLATIYSPVEVHALFVNPVLTYSVKENWDIDFVGQIVLNKQEGYTSPLQAAFLRLKFSF